MDIKDVLLKLNMSTKEASKVNNIANNRQKLEIGPKKIKTNLRPLSQAKENNREKKFKIPTEETLYKLQPVFFSLFLL